MFIKPRRSVNRVFIHCSATDNPDHDDVSVMRRWHTDPKPQGRGWSDVGYHFFIKKDGTIQYGRPIERTPAAQRGHNTGSIAICVHGLDILKFTRDQFRSLFSLCDDIDHDYNHQITFHAHNEVNPHKTCPVFNVKQVLDLDDTGRMQ